MIHNRDRQILYVDDTEEQRYAMRRILEGAGFTVLEAGTGAEALRKIHPDILLVVLDVKLPDMSGYDVCRRIKAGPATASIPVLQISASFADPTMRASGLSGGADAYVAQPVHPAELLALVNGLIRSHDAEKTLRFQAEVSARLSASLDYGETLHTIETCFTPSFADRTFLCLRNSHSQPALVHEPAAPLPPQPDAEAAAIQDCNELPPDLAALGAQVSSTGQSRFVDANTIIVPLEIGRKRIGALIFQLLGDRRSYRPANLVLAEDLADRAALALQNARLYSAQQTAQAALIQSEKLAAAGRLSAAMAHEINNPLEAITNLIFLIDTSPGVSPTVKGYAQEALSELSRLTHIARQSLGFYRELIGPALFDLNESLDDTLNIYLKRFVAKDVVIRRNYAPNATVMAVKGELRQVISNLLVNALDALPPKGELTLHTESSDDKVIFRIADNGSGISDTVLARIFEPFFTTKDGTGTGLGLWVSENIIQKHGGDIHVTTSTQQPNQGTTFEITLPRVTPPAPLPTA